MLGGSPSMVSCREQDMRTIASLGARISVSKGPLCVQVGKDAVVIEADAIKNRDVMFKHLSSNDFTKNDPMLSSYVHEYSTKAAEMLLAAAGTLLFCLKFSFNTLFGNETPTWIFCSNLSLCTSENLPLWNKCMSCTWLGGPPGSLLVMCIALKGYPEPTPLRMSHCVSHAMALGDRKSCMLQSLEFREMIWVMRSELAEEYCIMAQ